MIRSRLVRIFRVLILTNQSSRTNQTDVTRQKPQAREPMRRIDLLTSSLSVSSVCTNYRTQRLWRMEVVQATPILAKNPAKQDDRHFVTYNTKGDEHSHTVLRQ